MNRNLNDVVLGVVDVQERLMPAMENPEKTLARLKILLGGAAALGIPFVVTEQYPKGLGSTLPEIAALFPPETTVIEKNSFSCFGALPFQETLGKINRKTLILTGVESHVCVMQTALDALQAGYEVILAEDCVDSRHGFDRLCALDFLRQAGVQIMTSEMILFWYLQDSRHPAFKAISRLVR